MGIDVTLWRARIGCFSLKNKDKKTFERNKLVLNQRCLFNILFASQLNRVFLIISVLLLLCGDVELNPGPPTENFPIQGTFHQGDELFSFESRGRQCLPCCTVFLIRLYMRPFIRSKWHAKDLDEILIQGDYVYNFVKKSLNSLRSYLEPQDLPPFIHIDKTYYNWKVKKTYSGSIHENFSGNYPFVNLKLALAMGLSGDESESQYCIFLCRESALAVSCQNGFFIVFDSHARNIEGLPSPDGTSVIIQKKTLQELCLHLRDVVGGIERDDQYDLHVIKINTMSEFKLKYEHKVADVNICCIPNDICAKNDKSNLHSDTCIPETEFENPVCVKLVDLPFVQSITSNVLNMPKKKRKKKTRNFDQCKRQHCCNDDKVLSEFHNLISQGPEYVCVSCSQLFFKKSVDEFKNTQRLPEKLLQVCVRSIKTVNNKEWICKQCKTYLMESKVPPCSIGNDFRFPAIPNELQGLTKLEERLISPRIPFMQIKELPRGGQLAVHGNIVNVPADKTKQLNSYLEIWMLLKQSQ